MTPCDTHADWIATEARKPGMWQWARQYGRECEADDSGAYVGLVAKVRALLGDFRPSPEEAKEWHIELSLDERIALAAQERQGLSRERSYEEDRKPEPRRRRLPDMGRVRVG